MDYQLVLQFPAGSGEEVDRLAALEDDFIEVLEDSADVEGHEQDSEVMNFCIATDDPENTFERLRPLLNDKGLVAVVVAAFRHVDEDDYSILWPEDEKERRFKTPV
jgi:hypothetical protein